ncbi:MAG: PAS domain-containing protein [Actinobacteria bacterium]|nr:PAS domain-containing protein [Actinomycetota bacterium]
MNINEPAWNKTENKPSKTRFSIRTKIIAAVIMVSFVTASLITTMQIRMICRNVLIQAEMQAEALTVPIQQKVDGLLSSQTDFRRLGQTQTKTQLQEVLANTLDWPGRQDITAAYIIDKYGKVLAQETKGTVPADVPTEILDTQLNGISKPRIVKIDGRYDTFVPYFQEGDRAAGYLVLGISAQSLWDQAEELAAGAIITFVIIALISVVVFGFWVSQHMVKPLERIAEGIVHGAKNGKTRLGRLAKSNDEIGRLANVTSQVLPELYRQQQQLKKTSTLLAAENNKLERTKRALMEMERYYRSAVEAATGVAYELDLATGKFEFLSRQVYETVGFAAEDLTSSDVWTKHIHEDDRAQAKEAMNGCLNGEQSCFSRTYRFVCKEGHNLQVVEMGGLIIDSAGRGTRISGIIIPAHMIPKSLLATA